MDELTPVTPEPGPESFPFVPAPVEPVADAPVRESGDEPLAQAADAPPPVSSDERTCVICGISFDGASPMRCDSRPDYCAICCPHPECHARAESFQES